MGAFLLNVIVFMLYKPPPLLSPLALYLLTSQTINTDHSHSYSTWGEGSNGLLKEHKISPVFRPVTPKKV